MPIIDLQRRIVESGRIRIGQTVASNGKTRPAKLDTFRLTSADRQRVEQAAEAFGGTVAEWAAPAGKQWEVITSRDVLDVAILPSELGFSQYLELWSAGGCQRRCDGATELLTEQPCLCQAAIEAQRASERECEYHTRLSVMLQDLPGLGVWRLDTQGWNAANELAGAMQVIAAVAGNGLLPGRLRLDQRSVKRQVNGKSQTYRFAVPVLDVEVSPAQLLGGQLQPLQLGQTPASPLTPVPQLPGPPAPSIAEQSQPPGPRPRRRNTAPEIPTSGRTRRTTEQPADAPAEERQGTGERGTSPAAPPEAGAVRDGRTPAGQAGERGFDTRPPLHEQPEPASGGHTAEGAAPPVQDGTTSAPAPAPASSDACDHPAEEHLELKGGGTVCGLCGERIVADEQAGESDPGGEQPARQPSKEGDEAYWPSRVHAVAGERGIDHDGLRLIGAALKFVKPDEIADWSMTSLSDAEWEGLDKLIRRLPASLDVDAATLWVWPLAEQHGFSSWDEINVVVSAAYGGRNPDDLDVAEWIAWGLRCHAGEYDAKPQAQARPRSDG